MIIAVAGAIAFGEEIEKEKVSEKKEKRENNQARKEIEALFDPANEYSIGYRRYYGIDIEKDQKIGEDLLVASSSKNYEPALRELCNIYFYEKKDFVSLEKWWPAWIKILLDKKDYKTAQLEAYQKLTVTTVPESLRFIAYRFLWELADKGNIDAMDSLMPYLLESHSYYLLKPERIKSSHASAERLIKELCDKNPKRGYYWFGQLKEEDGIYQNFPEALEYFKRSAMLGEVMSAYKVAEFIMNAKGAVNSMSEELIWRYIAQALEERPDFPIPKENQARIKNLEINLTASGANIEAIKMTSAEAVEKIKQVKGSVNKKRNDNSKISFGTGFFISKKGHIITAAHVVDDKKQVEILSKGRGKKAEILAIDIENDLALLQIQQGDSISCLPLAGEKLVQGQKVFTIGFPNPVLEGSDTKYSSGEVSSLQGLGGDQRLVRLNLQASPGNSGGPLLNFKGEIVGVLIAKLDALKVFKETGDLPSGVSYATKGEIVSSFILKNKIDVKTVKNLPASDPADSIVLIKAE